MRDSQLIAGAIVLGSTILAAGLYLGLHASPAPPTTAVAPPLVVAPPPDPTPRAIADAARALQAKKPDLVARCWAPALARSPTPDRAGYQWSLSFDAAGKQIASGIGENRGASRSDVAQCLRAQPMDLVIAPPGRVVNLQIPLDFP